MKIIEKIVYYWPGKRFGIYRFLPAFFALGAGLEFTMINWWVGLNPIISQFLKNLILGELVRQTFTTPSSDVRLKTLLKRSSTLLTKNAATRRFTWAIPEIHFSLFNLHVSGIAGCSQLLPAFRRSRQIHRSGNRASYRGTEEESQIVASLMWSRNKNSS